MNNEMRMRKRQMLESLEYLDDDLISGVLKKIKPEREYADPVRTWRTPLKHWKSIAVLAACTVLLAFAAPTASFISQVISNYSSVAGGNAGAGKNTNSDHNTFIDYDPYSSAIFDYPVDMTVEEIYEDVIQGRWVVTRTVTGESNESFVAGENLWDNFCKKSRSGEAVSILIAHYYGGVTETGVRLTELLYDGQEYIVYMRYNDSQDLNHQGRYKYLINSCAYNSKGEEHSRAWFLSNDNTWTWDEALSNMTGAKYF